MTLQLDPRTENDQSDRPTVLIVEDDPEVANIIRDYLDRDLHCKPIIASNGQDAIQIDEQHPAQVILVDYMLPDTNGLALLAKLNESQQGRPVILITGYATLGRAMQAMRLGAVDMFLKPFDLDRLGRSVSDALDNLTADRRRQQRVGRARQLAKGVLQDRRDLRRKMDLVCRDLVGAYEQLADKVCRLNSE